jgi:hypothetical protein
MHAQVNKSIIDAENALVLNRKGKPSLIFIGYQKSNSSEKFEVGKLGVC